MNVVFWFLVILGLIGTWFYMSFIFKDIGKIFRNLFKGPKEAIQEEDSDEDDDL